MLKLFMTDPKSSQSNKHIYIVVTLASAIVTFRGAIFGEKGAGDHMYAKTLYFSTLFKTNFEKKRGINLVEKNSCHDDTSVTKPL